MLKRIENVQKGLMGVNTTDEKPMYRLLFYYYSSAPAPCYKWHTVTFFYNSSQNDTGSQFKITFTALKKFHKEFERELTP